MNFKNIIKVFILFLMLTVVSLDSRSALALQAGDEVPAQGEHAIVKVGQIAPDFILPDPNEQDGNLDFKVGIPTVIISLHTTEYMDKLQEFQKFYDTYKDKVRFFIITPGNRLETEKFYKQNNITIPIIIDSTIHFIRKYNNSVPAMMITNGAGKVVYNSSIDVEMNSLAQYMDKLIAGEDSLSSVNFAPTVRKENAAPKIIKLGTVLTKEKFKDLDGNDFEIGYRGKPTVLLFWMDISNPDILEKEMSILGESYRKNQGKANFYTIVMASRKDFVVKSLEKHHCTIPTLFDTNVALNYTFRFPSIVVIDEQGVFRYRPQTFDADSLQQMIDESQTPYSVLPEPQNAEEWVKRGNSFLEKLNYPEAIDAYDHCLAIDAKFYAALVGRGDTYKGMLKFKNAYNDYTAAIELKPEEVGSYYKRAEMARELRQFPQMIADYSKIIEIDPKATKAYLFRGNYYLESKQIDQAVADYTKVIQADPKETEAYIKRGDSYQLLQRYAEAIADYNAAGALNPRDTRIYMGRGSAYLKQSQASKAIAEFSASIAVKPEPNSYYLRGIAYFRQGQSDLTLADLTKFIELTPQESFGYYQRGLVHHLRQEEAEAVKDFTAAAELLPRNGEIAFALAQSLEKNQEKDKALEAYKIALEYLPEYKKAQVTKAKSRVDGNWESYPDWIQ